MDFQNLTTIVDHLSENAKFYTPVSIAGFYAVVAAYRTSFSNQGKSTDPAIVYHNDD